MPQRHRQRAALKSLAAMMLVLTGSQVTCGAQPVPEKEQVVTMTATESWRDPAAYPRPALKGAAETGRLLDRYLRLGSNGDPATLPWPLDRGLVRQHLAAVLQSKAISIQVARRTANLARVYLLADLAPDALSALSGASKADPIPLAARAWLCALVGWLGTDAEVRRASGMFSQLINAFRSVEDLNAFVIATDALSQAELSAQLRSTLQSRADASARADDFSSQVAAQDMAEAASTTLQDVDWAIGARLRILALGTPISRIQGIVNEYLERSNQGGTAYLVPWAVLELRKHAAAGELPRVISAFNAEITNLAGTPDEIATARVLRGLEYFGQRLDPKQEHYLRRTDKQPPQPLSLPGVLRILIDLGQAPSGGSRSGGRAGGGASAPPSRGR